MSRVIVNILFYNLFITLLLQPSVYHCLNVYCISLNKLLTKLHLLFTIYFILKINIFQISLLKVMSLPLLQKRFYLLSALLLVSELSKRKQTISPSLTIPIILTNWRISHTSDHVVYHLFYLHFSTLLIHSTRCKNKEK